MSTDLSFLSGSGDDEAARKAALISGMKARPASGAKPSPPEPAPSASFIDPAPAAPATQREHLFIIKSLSADRDRSVEAAAEYQEARLKFLEFKMQGELTSAAQIIIFDKYLSGYLNRDPGVVSAAAGGGVRDPRSSGGNAHRPVMERPRG